MSGRTLNEMENGAIKHENKSSTKEWFSKPKAATAYIRRKVKSEHSGRTNTSSSASQPYTPLPAPPPPQIQNTSVYHKERSFDDDGNYTGPEYVSMDGVLHKKFTETPAVTDRNTSYGSTTVNTGSPWLDDGDDEDDENPRTESSITKIPVHSNLPLSMISSSHTVGTTSKSKGSEDVDRLRQFSQIETYLYGTVKKHPELAGPENESIKDAIMRILENYEHVPASSPKDSHDSFIHSNAMREMHIKIQESNALLQEKYTKLKESHEVLQNKIITMVEEEKERKGWHQDDIDQLNNQIASLKFQNSELLSSHRAKLQKDQHAQKREIEEWKAWYEVKLRESKADADSEKGNSRRECDQLRKEIGDLNMSIHAWSNAHETLKQENRDLVTRLGNAKVHEEEKVRENDGKWERKLQKERKGHEERVKSLEAENKQLNASLQSERSHKQEELLFQKKELMQYHEKEKVELRTVIEDFKITASKREHFKGLTDSEAAAQYKRLANSIDDFSRIEWEFLKEHQWPFSDSHMRQLSKNDRKLKRQIIQNTLWFLLFEHVFKSPFRILGPGGDSNDELWTQIYSSGVSSHGWPEVPNDEERARFENAKAYKDALEPAASNSETKRGFENSTAAAVDAICDAISKVATVQAANSKNLENIVHSAAKIWLESCSQRYRLVVILPDGISDMLSYSNRNDGPFRVVVRPELKRYGDSQGKGLRRGEQLSGWQSQVESYPQ
ncbi:hypothetical protein GQ44DRAFT_825222 [Phaeosphaeriaceae sp. PMI808]|nr:hypothetical protein GQ44DRAFT_825222 [Phaeosphaeriaceae sp. PMI808]